MRTGEYSEWTPPDGPNPQAILEEARNDTFAGRHSIALEKFTWFHQHAVEIDPAFRAVRLSFALAYWCELAEVYPQALETLKQIRDEAMHSIERVGDGVRRFAEFAAINRYIGDDALTRHVFLSLDFNNPLFAKNVLTLVLSVLIEAADYAMIYKYLDVDEFYGNALSRFLERRRESADERQKRESAFAEKMFTHASATVVGVLIMNGDKGGALKVATLAKNEWSDAQFHAIIDRALEGELPDPWP